MTEDPFYQEFEVLRAGDYAPWHGELVRITRRYPAGTTYVTTGRLTGTDDSVELRFPPDSRKSDLVPVLTASTFYLKDADRVEVWWKSDPGSRVTVTIQRVLTDSALRAAQVVPPRADPGHHYNPYVFEGED